MRTVVALYIDERGPYPKIDGVDCWGETRDARLYPGPHPVVAHPPCSAWSKFAKLNQKRYGRAVGDDDGCFLCAISSVYTYGGVLEHPSGSLAWEAHSLIRPVRGTWTASGPGWVTEVSQSAFGCKARKRTWLFFVGPKPDDPPSEDHPGTHQVGWFDRNKPTLSKRESSLTPPAFAQWLVDLARTASR